MTLWTAGQGQGPLDRAGLTVTSAAGRQRRAARLLALLDPDSDLADKLGETGLAVVALLTWEDRGLAEAFAGYGARTGRRVPSGGVRDDALGAATGERGDVGRRTAGERRRGRLVVLVTCVVEEVEVGDDEPLVHRRGRYQRPRLRRGVTALGSRP